MPRHAAAPPPPPRFRRATTAGLLAAATAVAFGGAWIVIADGSSDDGGPAVADAGTAGTTTSGSAVVTTAPPPTAAPTTTVPPRDPVLGSGQTITIAFAGDSNFEGSAADRLAADPASVLAPIAPVLGAADLTVANMETAIGFGGTPAPKEFTFQAPPAALEAFRAAGVDVVSAANNHGLDFGVESLHETLAAERDLGFPIIGIGIDEAEAYAPFRTEIRGQRIAVIAATQVLDDSLIDVWTAAPDTPGLASAKRVDRLVAEVAAARATSDTVVVFLHWGIEQQTCPSTSQQELARQLVDAGADIVVGGHAHRLQGGGRLDGAVVHYGLGNFGFNALSVDGARSGVFTVSITGRRVEGYTWTPARIVDRQPIPLEGDEAAEHLAYWEGLRDCTDLTP